MGSCLPDSRHEPPPPPPANAVRGHQPEWADFGRAPSQDVGAAVVHPHHALRGGHAC